MKNIKRIFNRLLLKIKNPKTMKGKKKCIESTQELEIGSIVIPHSNNNSNNYNIGCEYKVFSINNPESLVAQDPNTGTIGNNLLAKDVYLKCEDSLTKEDLEKEKEELECELNDINTKIKFMDENGFDEFDEDEYRIFKSLDVLDDNGKSRKEKAKELKKLLNNESCSSDC